MIRLKAILLYLLLAIVSVSPAHAGDTLSVLYFDNTSGDANWDWLRKGIADMLLTDIARAPQIQIVERQALEKVIQEHKLAQTGLADPASAIELGKLLSASTLIYGSYVIHGQSIRMDARVASVETGEIQASLSADGKLQKLFDVEKDLARKVFDHLTLKAPSSLSLTETASLPAAETYYTGLSLLDEGKADEARQKFQEAKELDPLYRKPQQGLEDAYRFLKDFRKLRQQREIQELYQTFDALRTRLEAENWQTYADLIQTVDFASMTPEQTQRFNEENQVYFLCQTRAQCTWQAMLTLYDVGAKQESYFGDVDVKRKVNQEIVRIGDQSKDRFAGDPFLPEILYVQLLGLDTFAGPKEVKARAEEYLIAYPDFRLIEFIEDVYERALEDESGGR